MAFRAAGRKPPTIVNSSVARTREYLTGREIETLMAVARKSSRYGHRDATMILIAYRQGLRASEICDLQWHQVELTVLRHACGYALANAGHDTRALQAWLGHRNIQHTVRYTELSPTRFRDFWKD
jgi:site-specific recombinase XerD